MRRVVAADELFERLDGLLWARHRVELVSDAASSCPECAVELVVDSLKHIKIELSSHTVAVVICPVEHAGIFLQVDTDEQSAA